MKGIKIIYKKCHNIFVKYITKLHVLQISEFGAKGIFILVSSKHKLVYFVK